MTSPSVRSSTTSADTTATTTHTVSYPATISAGDLLLSMLAVDVTGTSMVWPSGWNTIVMTGGGTMCHIGMKIAAGSETGTFSITSSTSQESQHVTYSIRDWSGNIGDVSWNGLYLGSSTSKDPPEALTGLASHDWMYVAGCIVDSSKTISGWPTGYSDNQATSNGFLTMAVATKASTGSTSDDPSAFSYSGADDGFAFSMAIPGAGLTNPFPRVKATRHDTVSTESTGPVITMPSDIASGDLLLLHIAADGAPSINTGSDLGTWTLIDSTANGTATSSYVYGKIAAGTEDGGTMTLTTDSEQFQFCVYVIEQWSGDLDDIETALSDGSSAAPDPGSITPSWGTEDALWAYFGGTDSTSGLVTAWSTGYYNQTNIIGTAGGSCGSFAAFHRESASSVDPSALTTTPTDNWAVVALVIRPEAAGGGSTTKANLIKQVSRYQLGANSLGRIQRRS